MRAHLLVLGFVIGLARAAAAQPAPACTYTPHPASDFGLPAALVGSTVSVRHCTDGSIDTLHAALALGPFGELPVSGPYLGTGACLAAPSASEIWPGFAPSITAKLCHDADGAWRPRVSGRLPVGRTAFDLIDAAVEYVTDRYGAVRLKLPNLALGPFSITNATLTTSMIDSQLRPTGLAGTLRWGNAASGAQLNVNGTFTPDTVDIAVAIPTAIANVPFPGITLPPASAHLVLAGDDWRLRLRAQGPAQLGPLGTIDLTGSELEVGDHDGTWWVGGCLESSIGSRNLGVVQLANLHVKACGGYGDASVSLTAAASFPSLGIPTLSIAGDLVHANDTWSALLRADGRVTIGPFANVALTGTLSLGGTAAAPALDGCLRGDATLSSLSGVPAALHASLGRCTTGSTELAVTVDGSVTLPTATATVHGVLTGGTGTDWSLHLDSTNVVLGPVALDHVTVDAGAGAPVAFTGEAHVGPLHLRAAGAIAPVGTFDLAIGLVEPAVLPGGITIFETTGSRLRWDGSAWRLDLTVGVRIDAGPLGILTAHGSLAAVLDAPTGGLALSGCVALDALPASLPLTNAHASACWNGSGFDVHVDGQITVNGSPINVGGNLTSGASGTSFDLTIANGQTLTLAPGITLDNVHLAAATGTGFALTGRFCAGGLCFSITGQWNPSGTSTLTASLAAGAPGWKPFASVPLTFTGGITGTLVVTGGNATLDVTATSTQSYAIAPGFTLTSVYAKGHIVSGGAWSASLGGTATIAFGSNLAVTVEGTVDSAGTWTLTGSVIGTLDPLSALIGTGRFTVINPTFTVTATTASAQVTFSAALSLCLLGGCNASNPALSASVRGGVIGGAQPGVWFAATMPGVNLPGFGTISASIGATTVAMPNFDLMNTPADASDDITLQPGFALGAMAPLPVKFGPTPTQARLVAIIAGPTLISVTASLVLNLDIVHPADHLPGVSQLTLQTVSVSASITNGVPTVGVSASASFTPANQPNPLLGTAQLSMSATGDLGLDLSLTGRWFEPFGLPKIAIQNPAFALSINVSSSLPIPSRIGINGDFFWLKSGAWPSLTTWPLPVYGQPNPVPTNVMQLGGTLYFDAIPTPSGLCLGACLPLPAVIVRFDLHNLGVADIARLASDMKTGARNLLLSVAPAALQPTIASLIPDGAFAMNAPAPLDITINDFELYLSTHNLTQWGMNFTAGFRALLDATVSGKHVVMKGVLDQQGLLVEGRLSPLSVLGLSLGGDPMKKTAAPGTGSISVPADARLSVTQGTVEGAVRAPAAGGTLVSHLSGSSGYRVRLLAATSGKLPVELAIGNGTVTTLVTAPIVPVDEWHHVAVTFESTGARVLVDGAPVPFTTTTTPPAPAAISLPLTIGTGLTGVDEVRVWNVARNADVISRDQSAPPFTAYADPTLVVRLGFDFDALTGGTAWNQRLYIAPATALHGTYVGAAKPIADARETDMLAQIRLALPGSGDSGVAVRAGASLDLPPLGGSKQVALALAVGTGNATGKLFMPQAPLMTLPGFGSLVVGGKGENGLSGDFDDGVFGAFDVAAGSIAATAGLYFMPTTGARQTLFDGSLSWMNHKLTVDGTTAWSTTLPGGAPMSLNGNGHYDSDTGVLSVDGNLSVFGQNLVAGAIKVGSAGITLHTTLDLNTVASVPLGTTTLDFTLAYSPARLCGGGASSIKLPGTTTTVAGTVNVCLGASPSLTFDGTLSSLTVAGVTIQNAHITYAQATGLSVSGTVSMPGVFTGTVAGSWVSPTNFSLTATAAASLGGFTLSSSTVTLSPSGFSVHGGIDLKVYSATVDVSVSSTGAFTYTHTMDASLGGFTIDNATLTLTSGGLQVAGHILFLGNSETISGRLYPDGAYNWDSTSTVVLGGWTLASADLHFAAYTTAHPRPAGDPVAGLRVSGSLAIPGGTLAVDTSISPTTGFSFTATPALTISGFALSSTTVSLSSADGLHLHGSVKIGSTYVVIDGDVPNSSSYSLCSAANTSANMASGLPDLKAAFCLTRSSGATSLSGNGKATMWGLSFSASFTILPTGGIDYLYIDAAVRSFSLLGVTAAGRIKLKVDNNALIYVRWYGSLYVPNPIPGFGPLVDFASYINLSGGFSLCPSDFGIDPTAFGLPSGCVNLEL